VTTKTELIRSPKYSFSRSLVNLLRALRNLVFVLLTPFDYFCRTLNGKADFPPLHLRRYVGPLRTFETSGAEFMSYLRLVAGLKANETILDIGCGCGLMALFLRDFLDGSGRYVGVDLHRPSIRWCDSHISYEHRNFQFQNIDVKSVAYNPQGKHSGESFTFPFESQSFDVILLKSVFTHMRPKEVENYLSEIARLLKKDGRCLATFFLLNKAQEQLATAGRNMLNFSFGSTPWRYVYKHSPESASAYDESYILGLLEEQKLSLRSPVRYGTWTGRHDGLSFQDLLLIEKKW